MTRRTSRPRRRQRGFALVFTSAGIMALILFCAAAIDLGVGWLVRARLNKAVDAAALIAAKYAAQGLSSMQSAAVAVGEANYPAASFTTTITDQNDLTIVRVEGRATVPTFFGRIAGVQNFQSASAAEVTRYPLDLSLVLDVSGSISKAGAWPTLVDAAKTFIDFFDEQRDQVGVVIFATTAGEVYPIQKNFKAGAKATIDTLQPKNDTNIQHGLFMGHQMLLAAPVRQTGTPRRVVMVLFTDGRANAFTGVMNDIQPSPDATCAYQGAIPSYYGALASFMTGTPLRALTEPGLEGNDRRIECFAGTGLVDTTTTNVQPPPQTPVPSRLPDGNLPTGDNLRTYATAVALGEASAARADHITIYTIGLGNPTAPQPEYVPDQTFLSEVANQNGMVDPSQPEGQMFFAPDRQTLQLMFEQVASRILTRLTL